MPDFARSQNSAHKLILRWGGAGSLIRAGVSRPITCARLEYKASERGLFADSTCIIRISAKGLSIPPQHEQDQVSFNGVLYNIALPVNGPRPNGTVIYYDANCLEVNPATNAT